MPSCENLQSRGLSTNTACTRCGEHESIDHILFHCNFAKEVWRMGPWTNAFSITAETSFKPSLYASYLWKILPPVGTVGNLFPWICWHPWISRNKLLFDNLSSAPRDVLLQSICAMKEWEAANPNRPTATPIPPPISRLPRPSMISTFTTVCHTDASWKAGSAVLAWIFSDHAGTESSHKAISLNHVSSPLMAEALAIRGALMHAASIKITHICLRSDSQVLIQAICQRKLIMELYGVLSDIDSLSFSAVSPFVFCCFDFIPCTENGHADQLAKAQLEFSLVTPFNGLF